MPTRTVPPIPKFLFLSLLLLTIASSVRADVPLIWETQPVTAERAENGRVGFGTRNGDTVLAGSAVVPAAAGRFAFAVRHGWNGEILWARDWPELGNAQVNGGAEASNGDLLFIATGVVDLFRHEFLAFRTDPAGNILWTKRVAGTATGPVSLAVRADDSFVAASGYYRDGRLHAFDGNGDLLWSYAPADGSKFYGVVPLPDGGILALGHTGNDLGGRWLGGMYYYDCGSSPADACGTALAVRLDRDGTPAWRHSYPGIPATLLQNGTADARGATVVGQTLRPAGAGADLALARIDLSGNLLWTRFLGGPSIDEPAGLAPAGDGGYLLLANSSSCGDSPASWFARVGPDGARLWHQDAIAPTAGKPWASATSLSVLPVGGYAVSGTVSSGYYMATPWAGDLSDAHVSVWGPPDARVPAETCNPFLEVPPPPATGNPPPVRPVRIDVRPGTDKLETNPGNRGLVEVAIFSGDSFDTRKIAASSLRFAGASPKANPDGKVVLHRRDVDKDGREDLSVFFRPVPDLYGNVVPETLTGETTDGEKFEGSAGVLWKAAGKRR